MKNQGRVALLNAVTVFSLFIAGCKGGESPFIPWVENSDGPYMDWSRGAGMGSPCSSSFGLSVHGDPAWSGGYCSTVDVMAHQSTQTEQCTAEPGMCESVHSRAYNMHGMPSSENIVADGAHSTGLDYIDLTMFGSEWQGCRPFEEESIARQPVQLGQQQRMAHPGMDVGVFHGAENTTITPSMNGHAAASENADLSFINLDKDSSIWKGLEEFRTMEDMIQCYSQPEHYKEITRAGESPFNEVENSTARPSIGEKRKTDEINSSLTPYGHQSIAEAKRNRKDRDLPIQGSQMPQSGATNDDDDGSTDPSTSPCSSIKLKIAKRQSYKLNKKSIYTHNVDERSIKEEIKVKSYQAALRKDIEDFSRQIIPETEKNALWHFIARRSTTINTKYKDLLGLQELSKNGKNRKILERLRGFYPGLIDDTIEYIKTHRPMKSDGESHSIGWCERLGDVYIRKDLEPNYYALEESNAVEQMDKKYYALAWAVRMITKLPEVYKDFCKITPNFIEETKTSDIFITNLQNSQILLKVQELMQPHVKEERAVFLYDELYCVFKDIHGEEVLQELTAVDLYRAIYTILADFYENAEIVSRYSKHSLAGKCIISNQKYIKCNVRASMGSKDTGGGVLSAEYSLAYNKWSISLDICAHYHVYYVDNARGELRKLCMPVYADERGERHYLHTISDTVDHIKELYGIEETLDIIHPFMLNKETTEWSYIKEKERGKTAKDLAGYEIVFYHIDEDLGEKKFTFAEFMPLISHDDDSFCVPLFLTPLMQSAADLGPFAALGEHKELGSIEFEGRKPDTYTYNHTYGGMHYLNLHKYYSNLYILQNKKESMDCYIMDCKAARQEDGTIEAAWYVRMPSSVDEYTHCILDSGFAREEGSKKFGALVAEIESREYCQDSKLQGFWLSNGHTAGCSGAAWKGHKVFNLLPDKNCYKKPIDGKELEAARLRINQIEKTMEEAEKKQESLGRFNKSTDTREERLKKKSESVKKSHIKKKLHNLYKEVHTKLSKRPDAKAEFIVFRNVNSSKSNLGAHNEILNVFISGYNFRKKNDES
ncbi:hypothetical protein NEMIN01_2256 [Nematocida minor]|uniref:uncharacterized protein n=1 Tax=Nematocida minor TaxID=1912983 RepID=UPI00221F019D|nr:uncharacterized protein NEMIN01_2256 [Nematocida minor]KAI5192870.1 hypothetical protein NEMIN01_2256 [Nematocida minor]